QGPGRAVCQPRRTRRGLATLRGRRGTGWPVRGAAPRRHTRGMNDTSPARALPSAPRESPGGGAASRGRMPGSCPGRASHGATDNPLPGAPSAGRATLVYEVGMHENPRARLVAYGIAVLATAVTFVVRLLLWPVLGDAVPHMAFFPAVMIAAYYGGF